MVAGSLILGLILESNDGYLPRYIGLYMDTSAGSSIEDPEYADVHAGKLRLYSPLCFFTTLTGYKTYQYQSDGSIDMVTSAGTRELDQPLKSMREIPVQWLTDGQYVDGTLPAESEIMLTLTDPESEKKEGFSLCLISEKCRNWRCLQR